jgi:hypothetical protein
MVNHSNGIKVCKTVPNGACGSGMYVKEVKTNGDLVCEPVPGGASLPTVAFSFADEFDASNNTWSRKTIDQTAQQICDRILGATWNGTKCTVAAGGGCQPQCPKANELCTGDSSYKSDGCGGFCNVTGTRECRVDCGEGGGGGATACTNPNSNETNFGNIGWEDCSHRCTWHFNRVKRKEWD